MSLTMYTASVPAFVRLLGNLRGILEKAAAHVESRKLEPAALIGFRLYPDMFPLVRQVQIATDMVKGCAARLAGVDVPRYEDSETSFDDLIARIDKTVAFLQGFKPGQIDGSEDKPIQLKSPRGEMNFTGLQYLQGFVLPNAYFHATTAYNILRHNGVELGKQDFIGRP
ncbi:DUF1993 family protein [Solimonas sp. K1W22B-7]|uniref:DUF1993 domain-containing protein n=1 Tax=Solimonas sp. K1W22B-7 TaxID=2303331 RepID=UPI000E3374ED|nr:DUF1993 family protein [Solimonas sp. K1W22B-7]AXQ27703.1 DUF1993 family protein [Solimonas sp. K1W22B-7]